MIKHLNLWQELNSRQQLILTAKLVITQVGIEFYRQQWSHYRALYPDVDALKPE